MTDQEMAVESVEAHLGRVANEFFERMARGEHPEIDEYAQRYPEIADHIHRIFPALELVADSKPTNIEQGAFEELSRRQQLGDFRILQELGRGGMGIVYEAEQLSLGRHVALKVLPFAGMWDERQLQRFRNEARAAATLDHPGIVSVHSVGCDRGVHYYAMQLIEGQSLAEVIAAIRLADSDRPSEKLLPDAAGSSLPTVCSNRPSSASLVSGDVAGEEDAADAYARPAPTGDSPSTVVGRRQQAEVSTQHSTNRPEFFRTVARLSIQTAEALEHAHQRGVIHRDMKPGNLLIDPQGKLWITDFGLARIEGDASLTMSGDLVGTYRYMGPERHADNRAIVDHRSDIYSLGVTIYELLTLQPAFPSENREKLFHQIAHEEPCAPRRINKAIPRDLETIVLKAMRKSPAERYATAQLLVDDLKRFLANEPIRAKRLTIVDRATKWSQRHTAIVWSAVALLFIAVVALSISTVMISRARLATQAANEELAVRSYAQQIAHAKLALASDDTAQAKQSLLGCPPERRGWEWEHLNLLSDLSERTLAGSWTVAFSPDGRTLVTGGPQTPAASERQWDANLTPVEISEGSSEVRCWDATTGELVWKKEVDSGWSLTYSHDGKIVAAGLGHSVALLDSATGYPMQALPASTMYVVSALAYSPNGSTFAFSDNNWLKVSDANTAELVWSQPAHEDKLLSIAYSPDGRQIASAGQDKTIKIWDATTGDPLTTCTGHKGEVNCAVFSSDGKRIASAGTDRSVKVWGVASGELLMTLEGHRDSAHGVAFSPDGRRIASVGRDTTLRLWDATDGHELLTLRGHTDEVRSVAFSPDGGTIATAGRDRTVRMWDAHIGQPLFRLSGHGQWENDVASENRTMLAFSSDGQRIVSGGAKNAIRVWNAHTGEELLDICDVSGDVLPVAFFADDRYVVSGCSDGTLRIWDAADGRRLHTWKVHTRPIRTISVRQDGKRIATGSDDKTAKIWDLVTAKERLTLSGHEGIVSTVAFSSDGRNVASGSQDKTVRLWDAESGEPLLRLTGHDGEVRTVAFSSDSKRIVSGSVDDSLRIWDAETGRLLRTLLGHNSSVTCASFSPDDTRIVSSSLDETVKLWDADTGQELVTLRSPETGAAAAHGTAIFSVKFSPDGKTLAAGIDDGSIQLWESTRPFEGYRPRQTVEGAREIVDRLAQKYDEYANIVEQLRADDTIASDTLDVALRIASTRKMSSSSLNRRAEAKSAEQRYKEALTDLTEAVRLNPTYGIAYKNRGNVYLKMGDMDKALADLTEAIRIEPKVWFYADRGLIHNAAGDLDAAIADYTEAIRIEPEFDAGYNNRGMFYLRKGDLDKALVDLTEAIRLKPLATFYRNRGGIHARRDIDKAIADCTEAIRLDPKAQYYNNRGDFYQTKGNLDGAIDDYTEAIRLEPKFALAYNQRGLFYFRKGEFDQALADYSEAVQFASNRAIPRTNRGNAYLELGDLGRALEDYDVAIELDPSHTFAYGSRGRVYLEKGDYERSVADLTEAIRLNPEYSLAYAYRANARFRLGQTDGAQQDINLALMTTPHSTLRKNRLAWLLATSPHPTVRRVDRAVELAQSLVKAEPWWGSHWRTLGVARYRAGDWEGACEALEKSLELCSDRQAVAATFFLAMTHWQLGAKDRARTLYGQANTSMREGDASHESLLRFGAEAAHLMEVACEVGKQRVNN